MRPDGRQPDQLRPIEFVRDYTNAPAGSVLVSFGETRVLCTASIDEMGERIFQLMLETASGTKTKSEIHGYGQNEFVPWSLGAVM